MTNDQIISVMHINYYLQYYYPIDSENVKLLVN